MEVFSLDVEGAQLIDDLSDDQGIGLIAGRVQEHEASHFPIGVGELLGDPAGQLCPFEGDGAQVPIGHIGTLAILAGVFDIGLNGEFASGMEIGSGDAEGNQQNQPWVGHHPIDLFLECRFESSLDYGTP